MQETVIRIDGMRCDHCVRAVKGALGQMAGVRVREVKVGLAALEVDPTVTSIEAIFAAIREEGFEPRP